jgi:hypothetical protein
MAGKLIVDTIDTDNAFITLNVQQATVATMNANGIFSRTGTKMIGTDGTVSATLSANTLANSSFQTGSIENYMRAQGVGTFAGNRNRIINGAMTFDQRYAGSANSAPAGYNYVLDRWQVTATQASKFTVQRDSSANTVAGFTNSMKIVSSSAYTVGTGESFYISQKIEGYNVADLRWGTANAKPVTLSFWVRSSLTGTFGGSFWNNLTDRLYAFTYTISAADTWEQKFVTINGDTTGTWETTNQVGMYVNFVIGCASGTQGTAGIWQAASTNAYFPTGSTNVVSTSGATWYVTGVQLEAGTTPTPFEYRQYGTELALCQRYYQQYNSTGDNAGFICNAYNDTSSRAFGVIQFPVIMRTSPTLTVVSATSFGIYAVPANSITLSSIALLGGASLPSSIGLILNASGVTAGQGTVLKDIGTNASGRIQISAEL